MDRAPYHNEIDVDGFDPNKANKKTLLTIYALRQQNQFQDTKL